jgi:hypothetical protein
MPLWIIPVLIVAVILNIGGFAGMLVQHATTAVAPSKASFQVEVGPTGMPWIATLNWDGSWITAPIHWARYLRHHPRTWSVTVSRIKKRSLEASLITEEYGTYSAARQRFREIKSQVRLWRLNFPRVACSSHCRTRNQMATD